MFGVENDKFSFIAVQFKLIQSHPLLNDVHYTGFDSPNSVVLVDFNAIVESYVELSLQSQPFYSSST